MRRALDLGLGGERRHRVHHDDVHRVRAHQHVGDLERLLAVVRLRNQQLGHVDAQLLGVGRVERVLGVDERGGATLALHFGNDRERERGLAGGFRPVDLDDAPLRQAAHAKGDVEAEGARGDSLDVVGGTGITQAHHRSLAELLLDLAQGGDERLLAVFFHCHCVARGALGARSGVGEIRGGAHYSTGGPLPQADKLS